MWLKSYSAALLLCGSLLFSTPIFAQGGQGQNHEGVTGTCVEGPDCLPTITSKSFAVPSASLSSSASSSNAASSTDSSGPGPRPASGSTNDSGASTIPKSKNHTGAIAGGVVGGLLALALIGLGIFLFMRRNRKRQDSFELEKSRMLPLLNIYI